MDEFQRTSKPCPRAVSTPSTSCTCWPAARPLSQASPLPFSCLSKFQSGWSASPSCSWSSQGWIRNHGLFSVYFRSFITTFYRKNSRLQRYSSLDRWGRSEFIQTTKTMTDLDTVCASSIVNSFKQVMIYLSLKMIKFLHESLYKIPILASTSISRRRLSLATWNQHYKPF